MYVRSILIFALFALFALGNVAFAQEKDTFRPLFNGKDLDGWVRVNTDETTWSVKDGMLICSGTPIGELRTTRMYQNFILEVEWRHMKPRGNAGIFVWADDITARGVPFHRSIELQVLENEYGNTRGYTTHGDIFPIHGAKMTPINGHGGSRAFPTENRSKPSPEWNHYRIECRDGEVSLAVNGKVVTQGKECIPRKGYICVESEGGLVHYRNVRIQELPDTPIKEEHIAIEDRGYRCLYTGSNLDGWKADDDWKTQDWRLTCDSKKPTTLTTEEEFSNGRFIFDVKFAEASSFQFQIGGATAKVERAYIKKAMPDGQWHRISGFVQDGQITFHVNGDDTTRAVHAATQANKGPLSYSFNGPVELSNIYVGSPK